MPRNVHKVPHFAFAYVRVCVCELDRCTSVSACCFDIFHIGSSDMNSCFDPIRIRQHHPGSFAAALNTQPERHTETEKEGGFLLFSNCISCYGSAVIPCSEELSPERCSVAFLPTD